MRTILFLLCAGVLGSSAGAQVPAKPKAKPAPVPTPKSAPLPPKWDFDREVPLSKWDREFGLGKQFAVEIPHAFDLAHDFEFDFKDKFKDFKFDHDFQFDFKPAFDLKLEMPHFELPHLEVPHLEPHEFDWAQGFPTPKAMEAIRPLELGVPRPRLTGELFGSTGAEPSGALTRLRPEQGSPEDSLYRQAREALNRGEYARASTLFQSLEQRYPRSRVAPAALYYRAFALYRAGATEDLRAGVTALRAQQERYPEAATDPDAAALRTRLYAALAARGDAEAASALRAATSGGPSCDKEDVEVRAEALNALAQINPPEARPTLKKVLARRDECSVRLRRSAVYILGRSGTDEAAVDLLEVARTDPDPTVRADAINMLGRAPGAATVRQLEQIFNDATDDRTRQAALSALRTKGGPEATRVLRSIIERPDVPEKMRAEAISQLSSSTMKEWELLRTAQAAGGSGLTTTSGQSGRRTVPDDNEDAAYLRALYAKTDSPALKSSIISAVARMGGTANDQFIMGIARNKDESIRTRREALSRLRTTTLSVEDLGRLFESLSERDLRSALVHQLASREEPAAVDKLIEIIKSGTDPQIRREAISALARRKDDPRATRLLLELVEKP